MGRLKIAISIVVVLFFLTSTQVFALLYAGNGMNSVYGGKVTVSTPSSKPYMPVGGMQASWVSIPAPNWIQVGWQFQQGWQYPREYIESNVHGFYTRTWYGNRNWGTYQLYTISYDLPATWFGYNGNNTRSAGPLSAPNTVMAWAEVQGAPTSVVNTLFANAYYRNVSGVWKLFNQANWVQNAPYKVNKMYIYYYRSYGP